MSKKTLYQYYADKDELVNAVFEGMLSLNKSQCLETANRGENAIDEVFLSFDMVQEMLSTMNPSVLFDLQKYHPSANQKFLDFKNQFLYKMLVHNLQRGVEQGLYRDDIDIDIMARYRLYSVMLSFNADVFPSNKGNLVHIEQQLQEHFLNGLATPKGQKLIQKYKQQRTQK
jgi:AcrR family transcriptional regulator